VVVETFNLTTELGFCCDRPLNGHVFRDLKAMQARPLSRYICHLVCTGHPQSPTSQFALSNSNS